MAKRRKKTPTTMQYVWYGLYAAIAYFGYNWYTQRPPKA
jgi:phage terminase large subunit-like protein